jgi:adenylate kinase family enzyme
MPLLTPTEFQFLLSSLAADLAQRPFQLAETGKRVRDLCRDAGHAISRGDVSFVLKGILLGGHTFGEGAGDPDTLGQKFLEYSSRGELVPDEITVQLWKIRIDQSVESHAFHPDHDFLVLDGIPPMVAGAARIRVSFAVDADGLLTVAAEERMTGRQARVEVRPSYGLSEDEMARMLRDSLDNAEDDMAARLLAEAKVEARRTLNAVRAALKRANFKSVRGDFRFGHNQFPVQDYVLRVIRRDDKGEINNRALSRVFEKHVDAYASQCTMK